VNLDISDNEFVVFLGPSGCGKTTTLRCIAGLEKVTDGKILFDETMVNRLEPADRNIAMVFQFYALYPHLNVYKNIIFPLKAEKMPSSEIREKVKWVSELLKIDTILDRKISALPDGDKQKVALARAIVRTPQVLLLDEPLSALDEKFREQMRIEFLRIQKALNVTTVYVTHDQREAMTLADRIVVMKNGKIIEHGEPEQLYEEPKNLFTGYFIGSPGMNFIECTATKSGSVLTESKEEVHFPSRMQNKVKDLEVENFVFGIRPEYLFFREEPSKDMVSLGVKLVNVERIQEINFGNFYLGEKLYKCLVEDGQAHGGERGYAVCTNEKTRFYHPESGEIL
jgi:ABC-type sugar transport system ATPase subunit